MVARSCPLPETSSGLDISLQVDRQGADRYQKVSYPLRYGVFSRIKTPLYVFDYNLNGEIKYIQGRSSDWPHPSEWLKRTAGNDWIYYYSGGYANIFDCLGEYYLPCMQYPTNSLWGRKPFADRGVRAALSAWPDLPGILRGSWSFCSSRERSALEAICAQGRESLWDRALRLFSLLRGRVSVLPPDARHVDYDCIPLVLADGCLYNCGFCCVKSRQPFSQRSRADILEQLQGLRRLYEGDLCNYCSLFLGQHDALNCQSDLIAFAAEKGYELLDFERSFMRDHTLLLFGSVDSLLQAREALFSRLQALPFRTFINIGLESADQATLDLLRKPVRADAVREAFQRMQEINRQYSKLEITANFILDPELPREHLSWLSELTRRSLSHYQPKGTIYLSPLSVSNKQEQLNLFKDLKRKSRLPMFLYLIQRL